jgi:effector-binding domain-containing protein
MNRSVLLVLLLQKNKTMKILKKILIVFAVLIVVLAIIGWLMPSSIHIERSLNMKASTASIFNQVNVMKNWENWSPWKAMDPTMKVTYYDIPSGNGASYSWEGESSGAGKITLVDVKENESVGTDLLFEGDQKATGGFRFEKEGEETKVTWYFDSEVGNNPFMRLFWKMGIGMMEDTFDKGLASMSEAAEKNPIAAAPAYNIEVKTMPASDYLFIHDTASIATIGQKLGMHYGAISAAIQTQKLEMAGAPFAIYYTESETNWEMDACIPVMKAGKAAGNIQPGKYVGGRMLVVSYMGPYEGTPAGHNAADAYIKANNLEVIGAPWEKYVTDPMTEKDTTKWLTEICYPVK